MAQKAPAPPAPTAPVAMPAPQRQRKNKRSAEREKAKQTREKLLSIAFKEVTGQKWTPAATEGMPSSEIDGIVYMYQIGLHLGELKRDKGIEHQFLKDDTGELYLLLNGNKMPLAFERASVLQTQFMLNACGITNLSPGAHAALKRLEAHAENVASHLSIKRFGAVSQDRKRVYVPIKGHNVLGISAEGFKVEENGKNEDKFWLEFPPCSGDKVFEWAECDPAEGLNQFELLCVNTMSTGLAGRWLCAMHEGLFPFIRESVKTRALLMHIGSTQQGKTTAAQRFTQLLGLGEVKGDYTVAALRNEGDQGLLALDNKEQANFNQALVDFCLFMATGAESGRSSMDGATVRTNSSRPVAVITSIEGGLRAELLQRTVEVLFEINGHTVGTRETIEDSIIARRAQIMSALMHVLRTWLIVRRDGSVSWPQTSRPNLDSYFQVMAELLTAFGIVAGKPRGWAERIYAQWPALSSECAADAEDDLEYPIYQLMTNLCAPEYAFTYSDDITIEGRTGRLYVTEASNLIGVLHQQTHGARKNGLPANGQGLSRRLKNAKFRRFHYHPTDTPGVPALKRTATKKPVGFLVPSESGEPPTPAPASTNIFDRFDVSSRAKV